MIPETININLTLIFWDTVGGIIKNLPFFILIIWGVKKLVKEMPNWINQVYHIKRENTAIENAKRFLRKGASFHKLDKLSDSTKLKGGKN